MFTPTSLFLILSLKRVIYEANYYVNGTEYTPVPSAVCDQDNLIVSLCESTCSYICLSSWKPSTA